MIYTSRNIEIDESLLGNYLRNLVNLFFKILPIRESEEPSLQEYMISLQAELLGCAGLIQAVHNDHMFMSLVAILQDLIDHPDSAVHTYTREVFKAFSICNKLKARYATIQYNKEG